VNDEEFLEIKRVYTNSSRFGTHWEDCWKSHVWCAIRKLIKAYEELRKECEQWLSS
jgi:predicted metal-binding transcription factor (methanogenesis marker protein 9)